MKRNNQAFGWVAVVIVIIAISRCGEDEGTTRDSGDGGMPEPSIYEPAGPEGPGAAVAILIDASGSMKDVAPGDSRPKHVVAKEAVAKMLDATDAALTKRPGLVVKVAVLHFTNGVRTWLPMKPYDREDVQAALERIPFPNGSTAIGRALAAALPELYRSGCYRKYIVVITDGENTTGIGPEQMAREIFKRSEGGVSMYFVAFDTSPAKFGFLRDVRGDVVAAKNAAELEEVLNLIYEGRILAEAMTED